MKNLVEKSTSQCPKPPQNNKGFGQDFKILQNLRSPNLWNTKCESTSRICCEWNKNFEIITSFHSQIKEEITKKTAEITTLQNWKTTKFNFNQSRWIFNASKVLHERTPASFWTLVSHRSNLSRNKTINLYTTPPC